MFEGERMKQKILKGGLLSFIIISALSINSYADLVMTESDYFHGLKPQAFVNRVYSQEEKDALKSEIISYNDIDSIIHLYNPQVLSMWNEWENNKSANDIYSDYNDAASNLFSNAASQDSDVSQAMMSAQANAMLIQADKNADDSYTNFLTNFLTENNLILTTRKLEIEYFKSIFVCRNADESLNEANRKLDSVKNNFDLGNATRVDILTAEKNVADAKSASVKAKSDFFTYKRNFLLNLGRESNEEPYILPIDLDTLDYINSIVFDDDYKKALNNNIQYEIYKRKEKNAVTTEVKNEYQILINAAPQKIYNDLDLKYNNILNAIDTLKNRKTACNLAKDSFQKADNSYKNGSISLKEYQSAQTNVVIADNNLEIALYDVKIACEEYKALVDGFGNC